MSTELDKLLAQQKELVSSGQKNNKAYQDIAAQVRVAKDAIKEKHRLTATPPLAQV